ncbi:MAG: S41 family peptidase, partial [Planctomycetota bacterium]
EEKSEEKPEAADESGAKSDDSKAAKKDGKDAKEPKNRWLEAVSFTVRERVGGATNDRNPVPSPDGRFLAFRRGRGDLCLFELATENVTVFRSGWDPSIEYVWSPDGTAIAFAQHDVNFNKDVWIAPVDGSKPPVNVTRHPDNDTRPRFSRDGKVLAFLSERSNEEFDAWYVFLDKSLETLSRFELEQHWKAGGEAIKKQKPPTKKQEGKDATAPTPPATMPTWDLADAYLRVRRITSAPGNEGNLELLPAGNRILVSTNDGLQTMELDGSESKKLTGSLRVQGLSHSGDHAFGIAAGKAATLALAGSELKSVDLDAVILVDKQKRSSQKFLEAARALGEEFYHPTMKGLDWPSLTKTYHQLALQTRTADEFDHVANRFLGELNASHLGIRTPKSDDGPRLPQGRIGLAVTPVDGGFLCGRTIEQMPATVCKPPLQAGDLVTAVDYQPVSTAATLESHFAHRASRETVVTVKRTLDDGRVVTFDTFLEPISASKAADIAYENAWRSMAAKVDEWSQGRIGYIHIQGMDQPSLDEFERGLYAATDGKDGLIVDVRNNGGGWTADRLLASLAAPRHAYTVPRGQDPSITTGYPQDRLFIQRCILEANMLCNEKSFSNAEITAHAWKAVKRGTLVGQQTYGGVISTGGITLLDGTTCRMPTRGWYTLDGVDMENHGAMPDLVVAQTPQDEAAGHDAQLKAAVTDLLARLPKK